MLLNAKHELTELGFNLSKDKMLQVMLAASNGEDILLEDDEEEIDETELERLLAGGLPFCHMPKECGHKCLGVKNEQSCLPCLQPECQQSAA